MHARYPTPESLSNLWALIANGLHFLSSKHLRKRAALYVRHVKVVLKATRVSIFTSQISQII